MKNRVRHNTVDTRSIAIARVEQLDAASDMSIERRYDDLYFDYKAQQRNVYIKPKRALRAWRKANSPKPSNGAVRTLVKASKHQSKQNNILRELGL